MNMSLSRGTKSSETLAFVLATIVTVLNRKFDLGLSEKEIYALIALAATFIGSRSVIKAVKGAKKITAIE